jgi:ribosome-binding protein aMBF1 (putative translation factor)
MPNTQTDFIQKAREEIKRRGVSIVRVALNIEENPVAVHQIFSGKRPYRRISRKLAEYLGIDPPEFGKDS